MPAGPSKSTSLFVCIQDCKSRQSSAQELATQSHTCWSQLDKGLQGPHRHFVGVGEAEVAVQKRESTGAIL